MFTFLKNNEKSKIPKTFTYSIGKKPVPYSEMILGRSSKRQSSKTKKDRKAKMTPNQTAASAAPPASLPTPPASVAVSNNSWSISSEDDLPKEDSDDETKDQSYGVGAKYKKSPTKGRGKKIATPQRNHEVKIHQYPQLIFDLKILVIKMWGE